MADDLDAAALLLWEQAQRQLSEQSSDLNTLRTRAVAMLSVASLVAGLFGSRLPHSHLPLYKQVTVTIALVLFAGSVALALLVAAPRRRWVFTFKLGALSGLVRDGVATPLDVSYNLAGWADDALHRNAEKLARMYAAFAWLCVLIGVQVVAWGIAAV